MEVEKTIQIEISLAKWNKAKDAAKAVNELLNKSGTKENDSATSSLFIGLSKHFSIINEVFEQDEHKVSSSGMKNDSISLLNSVMGPPVGVHAQSQDDNISEIESFAKTVE